MTAPDPFAPGARVAGRYTIVRELARGGMGAVYVARDDKFSQDVALKVSAGGDPAGAEAFAARFRREAEIGNRLGRVEGYVRALDWGPVEGTPFLYLVMDLVRDARPLDLTGGPLRARLERVRQAARLVAHAHRQGVIHRDLKPGNLLQAPDGRLFLTDFGLAKVKGEPAAPRKDDQTATQLTQVGVGMGTPLFMPPEQFEDAGSVDARADIYALGVMLFWALTGRPPYPGQNFQSVWTKQQHVLDGREPAPTPRQLDPSVPEGLDRVCARALALRVEERLASADDLVRGLDDHLDVTPARGERTAGPPAALDLDQAPTGSPRGAATRPASAPPSGGVTPGATTADALDVTAPWAPAGPVTPGGPGASTVGHSGRGDAATLRPARSTTGRQIAVAARRAPRGPLLVAAVLLLLIVGGAVQIARRRRLHLGPAGAPRLVLLEPAEGAVLGAQTVVVRGRVEDQDPAVPGAVVRAGDARSPLAADGTFELHLALDEGPASLSVAVEGAGDVPPCARAVTIDASPPAITVSAPADGARTSAARVDVVVDVHDLTAVEVTAGRAGAAPGAPARCPAPGGRVSLGVDLAPGANEVEVVARDRAGHEARARLVLVRAGLAAGLDVLAWTAAEAADVAELRDGTSLSRPAHGRVSLEAREPGRLYVLQRRPDGLVVVRFPGLLAGATPRPRPTSVAPGASYQVPNRPGEGFDLCEGDAAGEALLAVVLAREPVAALEALVGRLAGAPGPAPELEALLGGLARGTWQVEPGRERLRFPPRWTYAPGLVSAEADALVHRVRYTVRP